MEHMESESEEASGNDEDSLAHARIHGLDVDISTIVDFFYEKNNRSQKARSSQENSYSHEGKCHLEVIQRIHIKKE